MSKLIGLMGKAGSGKDTVADYLKNNHNCVTYTFAEPIKEITRTLFLFDDEQLYGSKKEIIDKRWGVTPRETWQQIGTNIMQFAIYGYLPGLINNVPMRQFWVYHFRMWYKKFSSAPDNTGKTIIITDIRFPHEANIVKELGGQLIQIVRPDLDLSDIKYVHSSETESEKIKPDIVINNNDTLEKLYDNVKEIFTNNICI